jgi:hypothetical protein
MRIDAMVGWSIARAVAGRHWQRVSHPRAEGATTGLENRSGVDN